jgi:hypothetical protein
MEQEANKNILNSLKSNKSKVKMRKFTPVTLKSPKKQIFT